MTTTETTTTTTSQEANDSDDTKQPQQEDKASDEGAAGVDAAELAAEERIKKKKEHDELTQRLQKLALERQKQRTAQTGGDNGARLKVIQSDTASHLSSVKTFQELNLPQHLLDALFAMGFDRPSAIQEQALPRILATPPRNLIGQAQSGSGKTAAFTLGLLYRTQVDDPPTTQSLVVTPTRELAIQIVDKAITPMAANMKGLKVQLAIAGSYLPNKSVNAHVVVGTPGKVVDWLKRKFLKPKTIKVFVLDEADTMVEEKGFRANSLLIKKQLAKTCQCLLFSATFPDPVVQFASKMVYKPDKILIQDGPEFLVRIEYNTSVGVVLLFGACRRGVTWLFLLCSLELSFPLSSSAFSLIGSCFVGWLYKCSLSLSRLNRWSPWVVPLRMYV